MKDNDDALNYGHATSKKSVIKLSINKGCDQELPLIKFGKKFSKITQLSLD